jgi:hypothetical protein
MASDAIKAGGVVQDSGCGEKAHRIACHSVTGACKKDEASLVFERRLQLELMVLELCRNGPTTFSQFYWIDVDGAYRPYYLDRHGKTVKFPAGTK